MVELVLVRGWSEARKAGGRVPASGGRQRASNPVASSLPSAAAEIDPRN